MRLLPTAVLLACSVLGPACAQDAAEPTLSRAPIDAVRMSIYRDFLHSYSNGSGAVLNVSQTTDPLWVEEYQRKGCLAAFPPENLTTHTLHAFAANAFAGEKIRLVDPKTHAGADPGDAVRRGTSIDDAVHAGFAAGLFTFSEIAFDANHTHAAFSYSFVCGRLCGHGGVVVYVLHEGRWSQDTKADCGSWIS